MNINDEVGKNDTMLTERSKISQIQEPEEEVNRSRLSEYAPIIISDTNMHSNTKVLPNIPKQQPEIRQPPSFTLQHREVKYSS